MHTEPTGHADSPSLDAELPLSDSETELDEEVPVINVGDQDEGQAGPNPGEQDEGQAAPNPEATDASSQQKPEQMDEEFTTTVYLNVQENLKLPTEDQEEARKKKRKKRTTLRTPSGLTPSPPPPPPPPTGASGALGISGTSGSSQFANTPSSLLLGYYGAYKDLLSQAGQWRLQAHTPGIKSTYTKAQTREQDWWKPLPEEQTPATPKPAWTIPSSNVSDIENNWASTLVLTYETPAENSLLAKTRDMMTFMKWYCRQIEECHKMFTDQIDWTNTEGDQVRVDVNQPLPLSGPLGYVTIQPQFFFNKDLEYLRYGSKGNNPALSISKMKAASYPDFRLELLVPKQMWINDRRRDVRTHMRILSVVRIKAYSRYGFSDGTLTRILEALDYRVKEFKVKWLNPGASEAEKDLPESPRGENASLVVAFVILI
ncbi:hypothetical protein Tco_1158005 [Tanacetum coccineum]